MSNSALRSSDTLEVVRSVDGVGIAYERRGEGPPLVLLHGLGDSRQSWTEAGYTMSLVERGYQVIPIDSRGHGDSDKPQDPSAYGGRQRMTDIITVLDALGHARAGFVGYSMGGVAALAMAAYYPSRAAAAVAIGAHPFAENLSSFRDAIDKGPESWLRTIETQAGPLTTATRQRILRNDPEALRACIASDRQDFSAALAVSAQPVLAMIGSDDPRHDTMAKLGLFPNVRTISLYGHNHFTCFREVGAIVRSVASFMAASGFNGDNNV